MPGNYQSRPETPGGLADGHCRRGFVFGSLDRANSTIDRRRGAQVTECDRLADLKSDPDHIGDGVTAWDLPANAIAAMAACEQALEAEPDSRHLMTNLGLALSHFDRQAEAMDILRQAADLGSSAAMNSIGVLHANDRGVLTNWQLAMVSASRAPWSISAFPIRNVDMARAMRWFRKAADSGDWDGILHIGLLYHGVGNLGDDWNELDDKEALKCISKAADIGSANAMYHFGKAHFYGRGVKKSVAKAGSRPRGLHSLGLHF